ncbi:hypothetical protein TNCV_4151011 [Trichonephila clavipes]|nr:hypothetical protein TNCV_4151011 [Trichonephila clavipes]
MGPKKTLRTNKVFFLWEGLRADVKKFGESCKECQLTRSVGRVRNRCLHQGTGRNERRYKEKDLATTEEKKVGTGERRGVTKKPGS